MKNDLLDRLAPSLILLLLCMLLLVVEAASAGERPADKVPASNPCVQIEEFPPVYTIVVSDDRLAGILRFLKLQGHEIVAVYPGQRYNIPTPQRTVPQCVTIVWWENDEGLPEGT